MYLRRLSLTNFRNYHTQELELSPGRILFLGENAQGKTNLLEAVFLLATGRSERSATDADFIGWDVRDDPQPFARIAAVAQRAESDVSVELTLAGREGARAALVASKRFKLNGVAKRSSDVIGAITAVLFTTDDMELVKGAPSGRRRFLDVMLSQIDRSYARALQRYTKVLTQRNALLKRIQEHASRPDELAYWDEQVCENAAILLVARAAAVARTSQLAAESHSRLSGERERFELAYAPRFVEGWTPERIAAAERDVVANVLLDRLDSTRPRDVAAGMTLVGPHRDDLTMTLGGEAAGVFASRGQQRTAALALRLAEAAFLHERSAERPVLLLDDVLSELDAARRESVLAAIDADQVLITSADSDRFDESFVASAQVYIVEAGAAQRM